MEQNIRKHNKNENFNPEDGIMVFGMPFEVGEHGEGGVDFVVICETGWVLLTLNVNGWAVRSYELRPVIVRSLNHFSEMHLFGDKEINLEG